MKVKIVLLVLSLIVGLISSCTPVEIAGDSEAQYPPPIYGTGGEHSVEPDNEKD